MRTVMGYPRVRSYRNSCKRVHRCRTLSSMHSISRKNTVVLLVHYKGPISRSNLPTVQVVVELYCCMMGDRIPSGLSENTSVKTLHIDKNMSESDGEEDMRSLYQALPGNMGIF